MVSHFGDVLKGREIIQFPSGLISKAQLSFFWFNCSYTVHVSVQRRVSYMCSKEFDVHVWFNICLIISYKLSLEWKIKAIIICRDVTILLPTNFMVKCLYSSISCFLHEEKEKFQWCMWMALSYMYMYLMIPSRNHKQNSPYNIHIRDN